MTLHILPHNTFPPNSQLSNLSPPPSYNYLPLLHHGYDKLAHDQHRPPRPRLLFQLRHHLPHPHPHPRLRSRSPIPRGPNQAAPAWRRCRRRLTRGAGKCALRWRRCGEGTYNGAGLQCGDQAPLSRVGVPSYSGSAPAYAGIRLRRSEFRLGDLR